MLGCCPSSSLPQCHYWILTGQRNRALVFLFSELSVKHYMHRGDLKGTRFNCVNCLLPFSAFDKGKNFTNQWYFLPCLPWKHLCEATVQSHLKMKRKNCMRCLYNTHSEIPQSFFPTVHSSRACFKWFLFFTFIIFLYFCMYSVIVFLLTFFFFSL